MSDEGESRFEDIRVSPPEAGVLEVTLARPGVRNALRTRTLAELAAVLEAAAADAAVRVVLIGGDERAFAAGADVREMAALDAIGALLDERPRHWKAIREFPKPLVAAVRGYALGGGCELMMHADIVVAGAGARLGQPEINLGVIPGAGGTQRLTRAVGKALAMKLVLGGGMLDAAEALAAGLVSEVVADAEVPERARALARKVAEKSPLALRLAKEAVLAAWETPLSAGLDLERRAFCLLAASDDRREGIAAFLEKRAPAFSGR